MRDQAMPDHRLERFRQRRDPGGIHLRDDDDHVAMSRGVSGILADDPEHLGGALLREVDRADKVGADVALGVAPADRKYQNSVVAIEPAGLQPGGEDWDRMLWASSHRAGVRHLLTEDLQDGLRYKA